QYRTCRQWLVRQRARGISARSHGPDRWRWHAPEWLRRESPDLQYASMPGPDRGPARPGFVELPSERKEPLLQKHTSSGSAVPLSRAILTERSINVSAQSGDTSKLRSASFNFTVNRRSNPSAVLGGSRRFRTVKIATSGTRSRP